MNIVKNLDLAIKQSEAKAKGGGYLVNGKMFDCYMTNEEWESFKNNMTADAMSEFSRGDGRKEWISAKNVVIRLIKPYDLQSFKRQKRLSF